MWDIGVQVSALLLSLPNATGTQAAGVFPQVPGLPGQKATLTVCTLLRYTPLFGAGPALGPSAHTRLSCPFVGTPSRPQLS